MKLATVLLGIFATAVLGNPHPAPEPFSAAQLNPRGACIDCNDGVTCCIGGRDVDSPDTCYPTCTGKKKNICGKTCPSKRDLETEANVFAASELNPRGVCNICANGANCCAAPRCNPICNNNKCTPKC